MLGQQAAAGDELGEDLREEAAELLERAAAGRGSEEST